MRHRDSSFRIVSRRIVITPNAARELSRNDVATALRRHLGGDGGDLASPDYRENDRRRLRGCRVLSAYRSRSGQRFWVITEADLSLTRILLPQDF